MIAKFFIGAIVLASLTGATSTETKLPYPPANQPLYLTCKVQGVSENRPYTDWDKLDFLFPKGTDGTFTEVKAHDTKGLLRSSNFSFQMKSEGHWTIYATDKIPSSGAALSELASITFLPPSGQGENLKIVLGDRGDLTHSGVCLGLIGDESAKAFENAQSGNGEQN